MAFAGAAGRAAAALFLAGAEDALRPAFFFGAAFLDEPLFGAAFLLALFEAARRAFLRAGIGILLGLNQSFGSGFVASRGSAGLSPAGPRHR
jgi:hypothetical protein